MQSFAYAESVSLHIDKAAYQIGDTIRFESNVVSDEPAPSKVLYVELLAPEGYIVKRDILQLQDGHVQGGIAAASENATGFFELRATLVLPCLKTRTTMPALSGSIILMVDRASLGALPFSFLSQGHTFVGKSILRYPLCATTHRRNSADNHQKYH